MRGQHLRRQRGPGGADELIFQVGNADELGAIPVNGECELASGEMQPPGMDRPAYIAGTLGVGDDLLDVLNLDAFSAAANESRGAEASR